MDIETNKLDVILEPDDFKTLRFLANTKRIKADDLAASFVKGALDSVVAEIEKTGEVDVRALMIAKGWL